MLLMLKAYTTIAMGKAIIIPGPPVASEKPPTSNSHRKKCAQSPLLAKYNGPKSTTKPLASLLIDSVCPFAGLRKVLAMDNSLGFTVI